MGWDGMGMAVPRLPGRVRGRSRRLPSQVLALHDGNKDVADRWLDEEADLGTFDLSMQRVAALLNMGDFAAADALCRRVHGRCPPNKGMDATGAFVGSATPEPAKAPDPLSREEAEETLFLSLSQQAMVWLQQGRAQLGLYRSGATDRARNAGGIGAQLEYAAYCAEECIDRAKGCAWLDAKEVGCRGGRQRQQRRTDSCVRGESTNLLVAWGAPTKGGG